jgi:hypothetical protein
MSEIGELSDSVSFVRVGREKLSSLFRDHLKQLRVRFWRGFVLGCRYGVNEVVFLVVVESECRLFE